MWIYSAYASIGSSHERHHLPCQDAVAVTSQGNVLIGAIADGAGSTTYGGVGAQLAVQEFLDFFCKQHLEDILSEPTDDLCHVLSELYEEAHHTIVEAIKAHATKAKKSLEDFATTFMGVVSAPTCTIIGHIGDGFAVVKTHKEYILAATEIKQEFVNQTSFVTDPESVLHMAVLPYPIEFLAMGTDGLTDVCLDHKTLKPHAKFFNPFNDYLQTEPSYEECYQELSLFLGSEKLNARTQDDKSLLIARWLHD